MAKAQINGIELDYDLEGSGEPLVLIHGAQSDRSVFGSLMPAFTERFRVLTFDQRGIGRSSKPDVPYSIAMIADDTAALMDDVGFDRAHVFGVSMGGMIGQELALRHPERVHTLIIGCSTAGGPNSIGLEDDASRAAYSTEDLSAAERARALASTIFTTGYLDAHPEVIAALTQSREQNPLEPAAFARRMEAAFAHDTFDRLPKIGCPTLVITGRDDAIIPWENSKLIAERLPDVRLVLLEPAGHGFWIEQKERTLEALFLFLGEQAGV
jgi:pimeloyl-ACP methyl ester carboxylesterase